MSARNPIELLQDLAGWLDAAGYGDGHPWRLSIAATLANAGTASQPLAADDSGEQLTSQDFFKLADNVHDVAGLVRAIGARAAEIEDELPDSNDATEPIRRLCRITAELAERVACSVFDMGTQHGRAKSHHHAGPIGKASEVIGAQGGAA